jgi:phage shock protein C
MFCCRCGIELPDKARFCLDCGAATSAAPRERPATDRLSRPLYDKKIAGVCAGFARYFNADTTLIRVLWLVFSVWPVPLLGVVAYFVAWIVMPRDPLALSAPDTGTQPSHI